jgi:hypothetical protein
MKRTIIALCFCLPVLSSLAQSEKYVKAMQSRVAAVDTTRAPENLKELSAAFERVGDAEKTLWLPYYYAALTQVNAGYMLTGGKMGGMADVLDPIADKAEALLNKAETISKDNSEIYIVKKMIASLRMMADPMSRYMQYGPKAQEALEVARKLNPENPRIYLLAGQDKFFTPEQFGGSKEEAKKLFEEALKKYDSFKAASELDPSWGRSTTQYFLAQIK